MSGLYSKPTHEEQTAARQRATVHSAATHRKHGTAPLTVETRAAIHSKVRDLVAEIAREIIRDELRELIQQMVREELSAEHMHTLLESDGE